MVAMTTASLGKVFERSAELTCTLHANVIIIVWRITPTVASMLRIEGYLDAYPPPETGKIGAVVVTEIVAATPPEREALRIHARMTKKFERHGLGIAMVVVGSTALKTVVRFVISALQLMSSPRFPHASFESTAAAAAWLATLDPALDERKLLAAIDEARSERLPLVAGLAAR